MIACSIGKVLVIIALTFPAVLVGLIVLGAALWVVERSTSGPMAWAQRRRRESLEREMDRRGL